MSVGDERLKPKTEESTRLTYTGSLKWRPIISWQVRSRARVGRRRVTQKLVCAPGNLHPGPPGPGKRFEEGVSVQTICRTHWAPCSSCQGSEKEGWVRQDTKDKDEVNRQDVCECDGWVDCQKKLVVYLCLLRIKKMRAKDKTYKWVSVRWKTKNEIWEIYTSHIHCVARGTGTPKDRDEVNKRDVCECDGWVWVLEVIGTPSILSVIRKVATLKRVLPTFLPGWTRTRYDRSGIVHWWIVQDELLKLQKNGQFPDETVGIIV